MTELENDFLNPEQSVAEAIRALKLRFARVSGDDYEAETDARLLASAALNMDRAALDI